MKNNHQMLREVFMNKKYWFFAILTLFLGLFVQGQAAGQNVIKIGVLFPFTGPLAMVGKEYWESWDIVSEMMNEKGGVLGKKIVGVKADAVDPKNAMSEAERLINVEKVNIIAGTYSSPRAMTASEVAEKYKKIYYETGAAADELTQRKMNYFFRLQVKGSSYGIMGADYSAQVLAPAMNKKPGDLKVVVCYEDSIWGSTISKAFAEQAKKVGIKISETVSYNYKAVDFSAMITRFKMINPDIVYGVNYAPDFMILWRQMKQLDLNMKAYVGNGTLLHSDLPKALGSDIDYVFDIQGVGLQNFNLEAISKKSRDFLAEIQRRHQKKYGVPMPGENVPPAYEFWVLLDQVLPMAGSDDPEAVRRALFKLDIPLKDSLLGFGIKFAGPDAPEPGQNIRAVPAVMQWMEKKLWTVYPQELATMKVKPVMPAWKERGK